MRVCDCIARAGNTHSTVSLKPDLNKGYPPIRAIRSFVFLHTLSRAHAS